MSDSTVLYGLRVYSELPLHQRVAEFDRSSADLIISLGEPLTHDPPALDGRSLAHLANGADVFYQFVQTADERWVLRFPQLGDFVVDGLRQVTVRLRPDADPALAAVMVTGTVLAFVLMLRGEPVLHASAVQIGERAVAFVGYSGMGKSTMAALVCAEGGALITDDLLRLDLSDAVPRCRLGATELRLRKSAGELAERFTGAPQARVTADGRDALRPTESSTDCLPLTAIVFPRPSHEIDELSLTRLDPTSALLSLVRYPRLLGWQDATTSARQFAHLATVAERVAVYDADVPWGPPFADDLGRSILRGLALDG